MDPDAPLTGSFYPPTAACLTEDHNLILNDGNRLIVIKYSKGKKATIHLFAGGYEGGFAEGPRFEARFDHPSGVCLDKHGQLLVADTGNNRIRRIKKDGTVETVAGNGKAAHVGGKLLESSFNAPCGLCLGPDGSLIVADRDNHAIRVVNFETQIVETLIGRESASPKNDAGNLLGHRVYCKLDRPTNVSYGFNYDLFICDSGNNSVKVMDPEGIVHEKSNYRSWAGTPAFYTQSIVSGIERFISYSGRWHPYTQPYQPNNGKPSLLAVHSDEPNLPCSTLIAEDAQATTTAGEELTDFVFEHLYTPMVEATKASKFVQLIAESKHGSADLNLQIFSEVNADTTAADVLSAALTEDLSSVFAAPYNQELCLVTTDGNYLSPSTKIKTLMTSNSRTKLESFGTCQHTPFSLIVCRKSVEVGIIYYDTDCNIHNGHFSYTNGFSHSLLKQDIAAKFPELSPSTIHLVRMDSPDPPSCHSTQLEDGVAIYSYHVFLKKEYNINIDYKGQMIPLNINGWDTIQDIRARFIAFNNAFSNCRALLNGQPLLYDHTAASVGLKVGSTLTIQPRDGDSVIYVKTLTGKTINMTGYNDLDFIGDIHQGVSVKEGIPKDQLRFIYAGRQLGNPSSTLADENIRDTSTIHMVLRLRG